MSRIDDRMPRFEDDGGKHYLILPPERNSLLMSCEASFFFRYEHHRSDYPDIFGAVDRLQNAVMKFRRHPERALENKNIKETMHEFIWRWNVSSDATSLYRLMAFALACRISSSPAKAWKFAGMDIGEDFEDIHGYHSDGKKIILTAFKFAKKLLLESQTKKTYL